MNEKRFWNSEKLMSILAILASMGTLFIIIYQTQLIRKQQHASVLPYLEVWNSQPNDSTYQLTIVNNGIGPAFIEEVNVLYEDSTYNLDHHGFYKAVIQKVDSFKYGYTNLVPETIIPAGRTIQLLTTKDLEGAKTARKWFGGGKAVMQVTYRSVYDERWRLTGHGGGALLDD